MSRLDVPVDMTTLDVVGYKAVHGGTLSDSRVIIDDALLAEMERMVPLAPSHNPVYLSVMRNVREVYPKLPQVASFETVFHRTIPLERSLYGIPYEWVEKYGMRRYGFHGSSHSYIAWKMQQEAPLCRRIISAHLGGSSYLCAILDGRSVATSMGTSPQSGLFHNNRVGDLDVFCLPVLAVKHGSLDNVMQALSNNSGFLGLSGVRNDLRVIEEAAARGNKRAELSIAAFADAVTGYVGMYTAFGGGLDALVFTGGIGINGAGFRQLVTGKLCFVNARLDESKNVRGYKGKISTPDSGIEIWSMETNEE